MSHFTIISWYAHREYGIENGGFFEMKTVCAMYVECVNVKSYSKIFRFANILCITRETAREKYKKKS